MSRRRIYEEMGTAKEPPPMTSAPELIARLRKKGWFVRHEGDGSWMMLSEPDPDCIEAADALRDFARLQAEVARVTSEVETANRACSLAHAGENGAHNDMIAARQELATATAAREAAEARYREEYAAVDRVWKALGITDYAGAGGKEISEIVADKVARAAALEAGLKDVRDNGLIYWEPNTTRGHISRMEMFARIDALLSAPEKETS